MEVEVWRFRVQALRLEDVVSRFRGFRVVVLGLYHFGVTVKEECRGPKEIFMLCWGSTGGSEWGNNL